MGAGRGLRGRDWVLGILASMLGCGWGFGSSSGFLAIFIFFCCLMGYSGGLSARSSRPALQ